MTDAETMRQLSNLLAHLDQLALEDGPTPAFLQWREEAEAAIRRAFGDTSREASAFTRVRYTPLTHAASLSDDERRTAFHRGLARSRYILQTLIQRLQRE